MNVSDEYPVVCGPIPGSVDEVKEVLCHKYDGAPVDMQTFTKFYSPDPTPYIGDPMSLIHSIPFDVNVDGLLQIQWNTSHHLKQGSSQNWGPWPRFAIFYSVAALGGPAAPAADQKMLTLRGNTVPWGENPPMQSWWDPWPPMEDDQPSWDVHLETMLEVTSPSTVWVYCYIAWIEPPHGYYLTADMLLIQEVI